LSLLFIVNYCICGREALGLRVPTLKIEASKISLVFASTNDIDAIPKYIIIEEINNM
jgi:hypothetical protein